MNIKIIKLVSGEEIVANQISFSDHVLEIKTPRILVPTQDPNQQSHQVVFALVPWAPFAKGNLQINRDLVVYSAEVDKSLEDNYTRSVEDGLTLEPAETKSSKKRADFR